MLNNAIDTNIEDSPRLSNFLKESFEILLNRNQLKYVEDGFYWKIGNPVSVQGWILHITSLLFHLEELFESIVPVLANENANFSIIKDFDTAYRNLNGLLGPNQLGKIVTVYPRDVDEAICLVKVLSPITTKFRGPAILTDVHLGSNIYTRYGSHNAIKRFNDLGEKERLIYNCNGELISDSYRIPFRLPEGISWPFGSIADFKWKSRAHIFHERYKLSRTLKIDTKGNVFKAKYFNKYLIVKSCVIKEGKAYMLADEYDRDVRDRLVWQKELLGELNGILSVPKVIDLFYLDEDAYLVMEYIKGKEFYQHLTKLNKKGQAWLKLPLKTRIRILFYITQLLEIVRLLHDHGIVHRDIMPSNFMLLKNDQLVVIDIELAFSLKKRYPTPPFQLGTPGFMSPEQERAEVPTVKEDIYGLAATFIVLLTGLPPVALTQMTPACL